MKSYAYGSDIGYTMLITVCCLQNVAYTLINASMQFGTEAYDFAKDRELTTSKKTPLLKGAMFHIKFIRLYFFVLWLFNTASTYMLFNAFEVCARPICAVFVMLHIGVLLVDWNPRELPIHSILGGSFLISGIIAHSF